MRTGGSDPIREAVRLLAGRRTAVVLTGAGISVESGIPSFRGAQGMWEKYDPMEYATLHAFMQSPRKVWEMLSEMVSVCGGAAPNAAHKGLAALEEMGIVRAVITQNVDGLHQAAGSRRVIEYHGNLDELICVYCWKRYPTRERWTPGAVPLCDCRKILKPNVVLFGEPIPWAAQEQAEEEARTCGRPRGGRHLRAGFPRLRHPADREGVRRRGGGDQPGRDLAQRRCDRHPPAGERFGGDREVGSLVEGPDDAVTEG